VWWADGGRGPPARPAALSHGERVLPIWLLLLTVVLVLVAMFAVYRLLIYRGRRVRDKQHILRRVADLEDQRRGP
jgi:hypothetical protein